MFKTKLSEDTRYAIIFVCIAFLLPLVFFALNQYFKQNETTPRSPRDTQTTVVVSETDKADIIAKATAKPAADAVREAVSQGDYSTAHMQLSKAPKNSPEYEELRKQLAAMPQARKLPGIRKEADTRQSPLRYLDESTPRDRFSDGLFLYLVEVSGTVWPKFCIQSVGKRPLDITGFRIKADARTFTLPATAVKQEKSPGKVGEYFDTPVDQRTYDIMRALIKARTATLTCIGKSSERVRTITEQEKKGLDRMMNAYATLGGSFAFVQH
ncbi:hypothetical protein FO488_04265 [Geobacter sp. FeAm09]|uniref:hypothetical protein n=1 Tax=Geobacter sp. FeAm09 TaxID=2597769 RepID=UPI0011EEBBBB|nr:hypothetical protein [Geobacter sp. FeAm09]QEM67433.1 hypothetical protein FO488_04265 [Geobacter sp. FeAm09]